ncbi:BTB/POZ domain-containing protein 2-like isoform X1 [Haliotis cracherodii]|uniref:BTB/POZ domain-containing protein 2-like isoform X1 n=2 Tax=Haliotis cracherodii TaxID=6455 RepID=UPI0039E93A74
MASPGTSRSSDTRSTIRKRSTHRTPSLTRKDTKMSTPTTPNPWKTPHQTNTAVDWQENKTLSECTLHMLDHQVACDVHFRVGQTRENIGAHKFLLISRSSVFFAMFQGPLAETKEIDIPDIDPEVFWEFLRFLYAEEVNHSVRTVIGVIYAAKKYAVKRLVMSCVKFVESYLTIENACEVLEQGYILDELAQAILNFINQNASSVLATEGFRNIYQPCLNQVLGSDQLEVEEVKVLESILIWADAQCQMRRIEPTGPNKRQVLGDSLDCVRFPLLDPRYFVDSVAPQGLFTKEECFTMVQCYAIPERWTQCFKFRTSTRNIKEYRVCSRFTEVDGPRDSYGTDAVKLICLKEIYLHGYSIYGPFDGNNSEYCINTVLYDKNDDIIHAQVTKVVNNAKYLKVMFNAKLKLDGNVWYTLLVKIRGPPTFKGHNSISFVKNSDVTMTFAYCKKGTRDTSGKEGQIPQLFYTLVDAEKD